MTGLRAKAHISSLPFHFLQTHHNHVIRIDKAAPRIPFPNKLFSIQHLNVVPPHQPGHHEPDALLSHVPANACPAPDQKRLIRRPIIVFEQRSFAVLDPAFRAERARVGEVRWRALDAVDVGRHGGACRDEGVGDSAGGRGALGRLAVGRGQQTQCLADACVEEREPEQTVAADVGLGREGGADFYT